MTVLNNFSVSADTVDEFGHVAHLISGALSNVEKMNSGARVGRGLPSVFMRPAEKGFEFIRNHSVGDFLGSILHDRTDKMINHEESLSFCQRPVFFRAF